MNYEKKYEVTITLDENNKLRLARTNTGFNGFEILGLLEIIREDIMKHIIRREATRDRT